MLRFLLLSVCLLGIFCQGFCRDIVATSAVLVIGPPGIGKTLLSNCLINYPSSEEILRGTKVCNYTQMTQPFTACETASQRCSEGVSFSFSNFLKLYIIDSPGIESNYGFTPLDLIRRLQVILNNMPLSIDHIIVAMPDVELQSQELELHKLWNSIQNFDWTKPNIATEKDLCCENNYADSDECKNCTSAPNEISTTVWLNLSSPSNNRAAKLEALFNLPASEFQACKATIVTSVFPFSDNQARQDMMGKLLIQGSWFDEYRIQKEFTQLLSIAEATNKVIQLATHGVDACFQPIDKAECINKKFFAKAVHVKKGSPGDVVQADCPKAWVLDRKNQFYQDPHKLTPQLLREDFRYQCPELTSGIREHLESLNLIEFAVGMDLCGCSTQCRGLNCFCASALNILVPLRWLVVLIPGVPQVLDVTERLKQGIVGNTPLACLDLGLELLLCVAAGILLYRWVTPSVLGRIFQFLSDKFRTYFHHQQAPAVADSPQDTNPTPSFNLDASVHSAR